MMQANEWPKEYYPIQQKWRRLGPLYRSIDAALIWYVEMESFLRNKAEQHGFPYRPKQYTDALAPAAYDGCDWRICRSRPGPAPAFWEYVCHSACHWTCSLHLWVASEVAPDRPWRIVTSQKHSTVWDGHKTLWDGNFLALGVPAAKAWELAAKQPNSCELEVGELMLHDTPPQIEGTLEMLERKWKAENGRRAA